jgi:hypothetical protein
MTIATTIAALQALHITVTGVVTAPTVTPASINTADLPLVLTIPGAATWEQEYAGGHEQTREYVVRLYVGPVGQDTVDEAFDAAVPIIQAIGTAYQDNPTLTGAVSHIDTGFTDTGLDGQLMFAGQAYRGCEFRVKVTEKW